MIVFLLFISPCLNSPGLAEQLEGEAEEGGEAREADTKTNLGISDSEVKNCLKNSIQNNKTRLEKHIFL